MADERKSAPRMKRKPKRKPKAKPRLLPPGRPHECSPGVIDAIGSALGVGSTYKDAAAYAGQSESCLHKWLDRARKALKAADLEWEGDLPDNAHLLVEEKERPFVRLFQEVVRARARGKVGLLATISKAAKGGAVYEERQVERDGKIVTERVQVGFVQPDWRAAAKLLAVRDPESYAEKTRVELAGKDGAAPAIQVYLPKEREED